VTVVTSLRVTVVTDTVATNGHRWPDEGPSGRSKGVTGMAEKKISPKKAKSSTKKAATRVTKKTSLRRRRKR
jgi:hypothetical protein